MHLSCAVLLKSTFFLTFCAFGFFFRTRRVNFSYDIYFLRERERDRDRDRDKETQRHRERQAETERQRQRERQMNSCSCIGGTTTANEATSGGKSHTTSTRPEPGLPWIISQGVTQAESFCRQIRRHPFLLGKEKQ